MKATHTREQDRELWRVGDDYQNVYWRGTQLSPQGFEMPTVYRMRSTLAALEASFIGLVAFSWLAVVETVGPAGWDAMAVGSVGAATASFIGTVVTARRLGASNAADAILMDIARAVLYSLKDAGKISDSFSEDAIQVVVDAEGAGYSVGLLGATTTDAEVFGEAYRQVFAPVVNQKYLVCRTDKRMPQLRLQALWSALRYVVPRKGGPGYFPVPDVLASRKESAALFASYWAEYVGGGELVYTRTDAGRAVLLKSRAESRPKANQRPFEQWV